MRPALTAAQVRAARMHSLLLGVEEARTPLQVATWFGAMQAQDAASGHWSLGIRSQCSSESEIVAAFERHEILRTWPMRGTIHIVPARDTRWMLELTGVRALAGAERRRAQLHLTDRDVDRATTALQSELADRDLLTRAEALAVMSEAGVDVTGQRGYHLLWHSAQTGVTCIGPQHGTDQTFALLSAFTPEQIAFSGEDALAELLLRYVRSHGPVGLKDFAGWSGLTLADARAAAALNDGRLIPLSTDVGELWVTAELAEQLAAGDLPLVPLVIPPGFDEFILGYKDRSIQVPDGAMDQIVPGGNGVFRATVAIDGMTTATWRRSVSATKVAVDVHLLSPLTRTQKTQMESAFARYAAFLDRMLDLSLNEA